ncbi:MAG: acetylornithine/succinylornithine family transaminase [Dorea sp.]|nr:acetylornithine/succinylornithine family transaminase [Dorea sp.]
MRLKDTGLTAQELKDIVNKYMVETYERYDFIAERAEGMYLYDEEGNAYLDFYGGVAVNSAGNRNPKVVAAIKDQVDDIMHTFNYPYTIPQALLAKKICDTIGMDKIFYQNSGTEANECMIKMARKYGVDNFGPEKYHIITAKQGFHGRTYGAMSATGQPDNAIQMGFKPMLPGFSYAEFNNLEDFASKITENTIAIMIEPVQGEGGVRPATQEFIEGLRKLCDEKGLLLLFDEVQTGWGRTGAPMAFMGYGVKPDAVSMAKAVGGGMPLAACCASAKVAKAFTAGTHGSTYGGHCVACAAGLAAVTEILDNNLSENAKVMGDYMKAELAKLPHVVEARGRGLLVGCEYDIPIAVDVKHGCLDRMALITAIGNKVNRMIPPLVVTKKQIDELIGIMRESIEEAAAEYAKKAS